MFKNRGPFLRAFLTKWTHLIKGYLEYQWPLWGTFVITKFNFLKTELDYFLKTKISRTEENAYFDWYFEASQRYQEFKIASLKNKILTFTEVNKQPKKDKIAPKASGSSSWASLSQDLPLVPSSSFPSMPPI